MPVVEQEVLIRAHVRSRIYQSAFRTYRGSFGYLLGSIRERTVDFALPVTSVQSRREFYTASHGLDMCRSAATQVAEFAQRPLAGVFVAFDTIDESDTNQLWGLFADYAHRHKLFFLLLAPIDGGETIWGIWAYSASTVPARPVASRTAGRLSTAPNHNPRRIHSLWMRLRASHAQVT